MTELTPEDAEWVKAFREDLIDQFERQRVIDRSIRLEKLREELAMSSPKHAYPPVPAKHPVLAKAAEPPAHKWWGKYWIWWLVMVVTGFIIPELNALLNKQSGDTLSENIRLWLKTDTPGGGAWWLIAWSGIVTLAIWLGPHIAELPGWPLTGGN